MARDLDVLAPPGGPALPLVAHVPHGGTRLPPDVRRGLLVDDEALEAELVAMTDWHTAELFAPAVVAAGGVAVVNRASRLVVDPERLPDAREPLARVGMGAVYTRTSGGAPLRHERDAATRVALLDGWFAPWAATVAAAVDAALDAHGRCLLLDAHSYPSRPLPYEDPALARPDVCLGHEAPHTPRALVDAMAAACHERGLTAAENTPFAGSYVPLDRYGRDARVRSVMVELRRDRYCDEATGARSGGFAAIRSLVEEVARLAAGAAADGWGPRPGVVGAS